MTISSEVRSHRKRVRPPGPWFLSGVAGRPVWTPPSPASDRFPGTY